MDEFYVHAMHKVVQNPWYCFEIEENRNAAGEVFCMVHIEVWHFTARSFRHMLGEWTKIRAAVSHPLYATAPKQDVKWVKFVGAFGFQPLKTVVCNSGEERDLYVSYANPPEGG